MSGSLPTVMTPAGLQPQDPAALLSQLLALVAGQVPGYTASLPGSIIEDISSTDVYAIALADQARVELVNSLTPYGANPFILTQLANCSGLKQGTVTNATAPVVFTGPAGYVLPIGFTVSDGSYQYALSDGGIIQTSGATQPLTAVCQTAGTFAIPAGSVTNIVTSVPTGTTITVTNPSAGTPGTTGTTGETLDAFRARVLQGQQVTVQGTPAMLKTLLAAIPGVVPQQVSVRSVSGGWEVLCGGGDAYAIAYAIYQSMPNLSNVVGSVMSIESITQANPGVVTTDLNTGYAAGQVVTFASVGGMTELNAGSYTVTPITENSFSIGVNTTAYTAFTSGGQALPNLRNATVTISDYPDTYPVTFVIPPQQVVNVQFVWNTNEPNFVAGASVAQLGVPAIVSYINGIVVGAPINLFEMYAAFQAAIAPILPTQWLTRMVATVEINGVAAPPSTGTGLIQGDPESFFYATSATVSVTQG